MKVMVVYPYIGRTRSECHDLQLLGYDSIKKACPSRRFELIMNEIELKDLYSDQDKERNLQIMLEDLNRAHAVIFMKVKDHRLSTWKKIMPKHMRRIYEECVDRNIVYGFTDYDQKKFKK